MQLLYILQLVTDNIIGGGKQVVNSSEVPYMYKQVLTSIEHLYQYPSDVFTHQKQ